MTDIIYQEYSLDLDRLSNLLSLIETMLDFMSVSPILENESKESNEIFIKKANKINEQVRIAHTGIPFVRGSILLLIAARFEAFVRNEIEDLAHRASSNAQKYSQLPRQMKDNLQKLAREVISNPKKYRMEKHVTAIANILAKNLSDLSLPGEINHHCLSITYENMKSDTINDLFARFGVTDFWDRVGANPDIQIFFDTHESSEAKKKSMAYLNKLMDIRNSMAHSPQNATWPSFEDVAKYIKFTRIIGKVISDNVPVFEIRLKSNLSHAAS